MRAHAAGFVSLSVLAMLCPQPVCAEWWLWESPSDNTEVLDQAQELYPDYWGMMNGHGVGQTFTPQATPLYRMDFMLTNRYDLRPFTVKLWKWLDVPEGDDYAATVAQPPLFEDAISAPGPSGRVLVTVFPQIGVTPGDLYYFEFSNSTGDGEWAICGVKDELTDYYPAGQRRVNNSWQNGIGDLYFKTYTSPQGSPSPPTFASSDSGLLWSEPPSPGPPITAQDYFEIVQGKADDGRQWAMSGPGGASHIWAMLDAFLYRATGDEDYAQNVAVMLAKHKGWWDERPDEEVGFTQMEYPGWAYLWVKDSPSLTQDDKDLIQALILDLAQRFWEKRELGIMNRSLGGCLTYKLVTDLFPGQPDQATSDAWKSYADGIWNEFKTHWDFAEDSISYNSLSWRYVLELAMLYGEDESIWSEPGFQKLVERFRHYYTPLGPAAISGDTNGWSKSWGSPSWLFDKAASKWKDTDYEQATHYKWAAYRAFDYQRQHIKNANMELWEAVQNEDPAFCHAYFDTDESIPPVPPGLQGEELQASQDQVDDESWHTGGSGWWAAGPTGQLFRATASPLVRIDLKARNRWSWYNPYPVTLSLWEWAGSYSATVAQTPLYEDSVYLTETYEVVSVFPFLEVEAQADYYVELDRSRSFYLAGSDAEAYPEGHLWQDGDSQAPDDLWFRTYSLSPGGSGYTTRLEATPRRFSQFGSPPQHHDFGTSQVPDKLVLHSGYAPESLHAVVNLIAGRYGHGHVETGAVTSLLDGGAVLLADTGYYDKRAKDHSEAITKRYWGGSPGTPAMSTSVSRFVDYRNATVAWIDWNDLYGWDLSQQRRFYFVKDRFLLVRDRAAFDGTMTAATGNVWHAYDVQAEHAPNWYDLYDREPLGINGWLFHNPERYALLYMVERPGYEMVEWKESYEGNPPSPPYVVYQKWAGEAAAGEEKWFDSLLLPHGGELTPSQAAGNIAVRYDDGRNVVFKVTIGDETWTLVDNPEGITIDTGDIRTDASYLIARTLAGVEGYLLAHDVMFATVDDGPGLVIDRSWSVPTSVEIGGD